MMNRVLLIFFVTLFCLSGFAQGGPAMTCSNSDQTVKIEYGESQQNLPEDEVIWVEHNNIGFEAGVKSKYLVTTETGSDVYIVEFAAGAGTKVKDTVVCN